MHYHSFSVVLLLLVAVSSSVSGQHDNHNHEGHRVQVGVYYESLCPDSRKFFTQQLYPSLQGNLSSFVNLTLVPYGKTTSKFELNAYHFECHHGEAECQGNKIQACALKLIDQGRKSEGLGFNKVAVGFINCLMDKADREKAFFPTKECAELNHVNNLLNIDNCANHTDGANYLANYGTLTDALQKPLISVPTIVFNGQYKKEDSQLAQTNFVKALCQYIHGEKPAECTRNGAAQITVSFGLLAVIYFFVHILY